MGGGRGPRELIARPRFAAMPRQRAAPAPHGGRRPATAARRPAHARGRRSRDMPRRGGCRTASRRRRSAARPAPACPAGDGQRDQGDPRHAGDELAEVVEGGGDQEPRDDAGDEHEAEPGQAFDRRVESDKPGRLFPPGHWYRPRPWPRLSSRADTADSRRAGGRGVRRGGGARVPGAAVGGAAGDAGVGDRRQRPADDVDEDRRRAVRPGEAAVEHVDVEDEIGARHAGVSEDDDRVEDGLFVVAEDRDRGVGRVGGEAVRVGRVPLVEEHAGQGMPRRAHRAVGEDDGVRGHARERELAGVERRAGRRSSRSATARPPAAPGRSSSGAARGAGWPGRSPAPPGRRRQRSAGSSGGSTAWEVSSGLGRRRAATRERRVRGAPRGAGPPGVGRGPALAATPCSP